MNTLRRLVVRARRRNDDASPRGQILLIFAFGLIVFIGFAALSVDVGSLYVARRSYQNATDAAALAGAAYLTRPTGDPCADIAGAPTKQVCARRTAWSYLNEQLGLGLASATVDSYANGNTASTGQLVTPPAGPAYTVWISTPPNGAGTAAAMSTVGSSNQVLFVRVERQRDTFFGKIFAPNGFTVSAWSTAGIFPNRFAVITLRKGRNGVDIDAGPSNTTDIKIAGTGSSLRVVDGDVGGNYGMKMPGSGSRLILDSSTGDDVNVYLTDYVSCGSSCWSPGQIVDDSGAAVNAKKLPSFVNDPNYVPPPMNMAATWPASAIDNSAGLLDIPRSVSTPTSGSNQDDLVIKNSDPGSVSGATCSSDSPVAGPGWYDNVSVAGGKCLIFSGNRQRTNVFDSATETDVPLSQQPGIVYITGKLDIGNSALVVADGVTIVIRPDGSNGQFSPNSGGVMDLNRGLANGGVAQTLGGWTTKGLSPYKVVAGKWQYDSSMQNNASVNGVGIALYVLKPSQAGISVTGGTNVIVVNSGAGLAWTGVTYAPNDNVQVAGQPQHDGIGQLISWTFTFNGGTNVTQTYSGPGDGFPYLIEPCVQSGGSCQ